MKLYRWIITLSLALALAAAATVCFGQAASQTAAKTKAIYDESADARVEIKEALHKAAAGHKRVIVVFGANWCFDCHALDTVFHRADVAPVLTASYVVVHIDIGKGDKNQDLMAKYEVPMKRGIPGLAVLEADGKLVYSQKNGEFENARALAPEDVLAFLNKWKPAAQSR
jgi:thiol:disulfide interchange protein